MSCSRCGGFLQPVIDEDGFHRTRCINCGAQYYDRPDTKTRRRCRYCGCEPPCKSHTRRGKLAPIIESCPKCGPRELTKYRDGWPGEINRDNYDNYSIRESGENAGQATSKSTGEGIHSVGKRNGDSIGSTRESMSELRMVPVAAFNED